MIRDEELQRLKKYAEGMGVSVLFSKKYSDNAVAEWQIDGKQIVIYENNHGSKLEMVLSLIHELGHHLEHVRNNNREIDRKLEEAIDNEEEKKKHRKKIYDWEEKGSEWWEEIYRDTNCKFPIYRLQIAKEFDLWQYEVYCELGSFPSRKKQREKLKELNLKYKKNG